MTVDGSGASGTVFDIQHYAVHDGPGIRTLVFLKGCPLRCVWCCNPESQSFEPELRHGAARCISCLRCVEVCEHKAAAVGPSGPVFDRAICASCHDSLCVQECWQSALVITGRRMTAGEVVGRVARDVDFYRNSGGGVTVSGGEPFSQPAFLLGILAGCRELGIHTAVETCGQGRPSDFLSAGPLVDLFLFDVKLVDPQEHRRMTGVDNALILSNLRALCREHGSKVALRFPLIPGCTDSEENIDATAGLALELGIRSVELQPYHSLGMHKYLEIGRQPNLRAEPRESLLERVQWVQARMRARGVDSATAR